jgi:hypothetical protein
LPSAGLSRRARPDTKVTGPLSTGFRAEKDAVCKRSASTPGTRHLLPRLTGQDADDIELRRPLQRMTALPIRRKEPGAALQVSSLSRLRRAATSMKMMQTPPIDVLVRLAHRSARCQGGNHGLTAAVPGEDPCSRQCRRASIVAPASTVTELMRLTRIEPCDLLARIMNALADFSGRLGRTRRRALKPRQHPPGLGAARLLALGADDPAFRDRFITERLSKIECFENVPRRRPLLEERGIQVWAIHTCLASELGLTAGFLNFFTENA